jgi:hypothetical protein
LTKFYTSALLTLILLTLFVFQVRSQSLSPFVTSTSGSFYSNNAGMLSSTIGELTLTETFTGTNTILTQGFQQVFDFGVSVNEVNLSPAIMVYPNPTSGILVIEFSEKYTDIEINVYDLTGRVVYNRYYDEAVNNSLQITINHLQDGLYFLQLNTPQGRHIKKIDLIK